MIIRIIGEEEITVAISLIWETFLQFYTVNSSPYAVTVYHKLGFIDMDDEQLADGIRFTTMKFERYRDNGIQN